MNWYFKIAGGHTHVRVFMNGGKCGDLCFRNEEFKEVREHCPWIRFIEEPDDAENSCPGEVLNLSDLVLAEPKLTHENTGSHSEAPPQ